MSVMPPELLTRTALPTLARLALALPSVGLRRPAKASSTAA